MSNTDRLRLVLAEDDFLVGTEVVRLAGSLGYEVVGVARHGPQAVDLVRQLRPGLAVLDIQMGATSGLEAARRIRDECPVPVVILTAFESPELLREASEAGVGAYLTKPPDRAEMERAFAIATARFADLAELRRVNLELRRALDEVRTLSGLIPMCSFCKRIRNDEGYWEQVAAYISSRTGAMVTHGFCPECMDEHYPEVSEGPDPAKGR